ncbi:MAG TPA: SPOR domain-containing protein [Candidatus Binatia bacterium]|nr:SPOR domain-containing protein [Candidatus Binatia bacterium]
MRAYRLTVIATALCASVAWAWWNQNRPTGALAATIPAPGQPAAPLPAPTPAPAQVPAPARPPTAVAPPQAKPEEQMRIVADPATNSLVIYGTAQEFQNIKNILKDLDAVPRQVLLDVLIAEVTLNDAQNFGIEYEIFSKFNPTIFGQQFGSQGAVRSGILPAPPEGGGITSFGRGISGIIGRSNAIRAFINALQSDSRVKILSSPSVLATDNRPARIQVGSEEPIPTGQIVAATTDIASSTTIQYRNTGRIVTIIPQVNSQGLVNLQILAEVSQRGANVTVGANSFPAFNTRQAETNAVVQDGDSLVIGGIIADNRSRSRTGIPYLMDIPVIGRFFGSTSDTFERTELIMVITPHVIRNRDQAQQVTEDFKKSLSTVRDELERIAREREKLQRRPLEQKPSLPGPSGDVAPPPNPPAPSANVAPAPVPNETPPLRKINSPDPVAGTESESRTGGAPANLSAGDKVTAQPPLALSLLRPLEQTAKAPGAAVRAPAAAAKPMRQWTVQVASLTLEKDARKIAEDLRKSGYDAYVTTFENENRVWHRVRVGRFTDLGAANELKDSLAKSRQFNQAYVAVH